MTAPDTDAPVPVADTTKMIADMKAWANNLDSPGSALALSHCQVVDLIAERDALAAECERLRGENAAMEER